MKEFAAALYVEMNKAVKSKMLWGTIIFFAFIAFMLGFMMLIAKHPEIAGNSAILSTKASFIAKADWHVFFGLMLQMALILGPLCPAGDRRLPANSNPWLLLHPCLVWNRIFDQGLAAYHRLPADSHVHSLCRHSNIGIGVYRACAVRHGNDF
jgi:hypothetical protein